MRHAVFGRRLGRTSAHRLAMRRNMVQSLIEHGEIRTTLIKAKEIRRFAERVLSLGVKAAEAKGDAVRAVGLRQRAEALIRDRSIIPAEHREEYDGLSDAKREKVLRSRSGRRYRAATTRPGVKFTAESVLHRLFNEVGPKLQSRNESLGTTGGYTRIIKLAERRLGDGGAVALLQIVGAEDDRRKPNKAQSERKRRAKVKYSVYAGKPRAQQRRRSTKKSEPSAAAPADAGGSESNE